jgi:glycosyltransferase involved in cell wall biosynthesis
METMEISVVIITRNEEKRLDAALKSVADIAAEIVIVDSFSTDDTLKIARKYSKRVYRREWTDYADQKNYANSKASFPWILSLDADERLSADLRSEILELMEIEPQADAFSMPRQVFYLGRWIRHSGWYPDRKTRLFRKEKCRWEGEYVHERLIVDGKTQKLHCPIHHFTYQDVRDHLDRINSFSGLGAQKLYARKKKCRWYHLVFLPLFRFLKSFLGKAGFLDGYAGFVIAVLHGYAVFVRYVKLREIWKKGERIEPFPT